MMMARTEPRTLDAAFIAQAHSTRLALGSSADGAGKLLRAAAGQGAQTGGKGHAHCEAQGNEQPCADQQFRHEGQAHQAAQQAGQDADIEQQGGRNQHQRQPNAAGFGQPPSGNQAARSARQQKQEHNHGQCVDRVSQKEDEALDESDLDQDVSQADGDKVEQAHRTRLLAAAPLRQGKNQEASTARSEMINHHIRGWVGE